MARQIRTNRGLYLAINALSDQNSEGERSLEVYLLSLLNYSEQFRDDESLTLEQVYALLEAGYTGTSTTFDEGWREQYASLAYKDDGYPGWHATLIQQIVDLREMDEKGILDNEMRYFGVSAPRGGSWYNFDPRGYLECAMAGSFGGWEDGDDTGRQYLPGQVAYLADDGSIQSATPQEFENPVFEMPTVSWSDLKDFIICGQLYE